MKVKTASILLSICLSLFFAMGIAWSQGGTAAINGQVMDPSGAAVAGASVIAKDLDRGTVWPGTSE